MEKFIKKILKFLNIKISDSYFLTIVQFVKFGIVGASNTLISYVLYLLVLLVMRPFKISWDAYAGSIFAFFLSVLWSYYWNNKYVFKSDKGERKVIRALVKTYISYGFTGFILSNALLFLWLNIFGIPKTIAPLLSLIVIVPINFVLNKFWAFKKKDETNE